MKYKHYSKSKHQPVYSGVSSNCDGSVSGNGDLCVITGAQDKGLRLYLSKIDLWHFVESHDDGGLRPLGIIDVDLPAELLNQYTEIQNMDNGTIEVACGKNQVNISIKVNKTENSLMLEFSGTVKVRPEVKVFPGKIHGKSKVVSRDGCIFLYRDLNTENSVESTYGCFAFRQVDSNRYYGFCATNHDCKKPEELAITKAKAVSTEVFEILDEKHRKAWKEFYSKSSFTLSDKQFENAWYASQYLLACCCGNGKFAPGLYGNFITVENPSWHSDFHLNYNYQALFYAACSSNHPELTDSYCAPLEEFLQRGREFASKFDCGGALFPVAIGPHGLLTEWQPEVKYPFLRLFLGQKSNGIHACDIPVYRWKATKDIDYARKHAYPLLKECLDFFVDYCTFEDGRFCVNKDAAHEVPYYKKNFDEKQRPYNRYINDKNNTLTLGMLRLCIPAAIEMAGALGVDEERCRVWQNLLDNLSPFPTCYRRFRKVYRYTESGQRWNNGNDVGLQFIYPGRCIGLSSSKKELEIARNTFSQKAVRCYRDDNAVSSFFPMAAHLGIDGRIITANLRQLLDKHQLPNMMFKFAGGGTEYIPIAANTLNEMALQSYEGIIRLFPAWDRSIDASFTNLRADGAFLVSSSVRNGRTGMTEIFCEKGGTLKVLNPFIECKIIRGSEITVSSEKELVFETEPGETIKLDIV